MNHRITSWSSLLFLTSALWYLSTSLIVPLKDSDENSLHKIGYVNSDSIIKVIRRNLEEKKYPINQGSPLSLNPTKQELGQPYSSAGSINPKLGMFITVGFVLFALFVAFKVRKLLKAENRKKQHH
jgi:hypothetical protein